MPHPRFIHRWAQIFIDIHDKHGVEAANDWANRFDFCVDYQREIQIEINAIRNAPKKKT